MSQAMQQQYLYAMYGMYDLCVTSYVVGYRPKKEGMLSFFLREFNEEYNAAFWTKDIKAAKQFKDEKSAVEFAKTLNRPYEIEEFEDFPSF